MSNILIRRLGALAAVSFLASAVVAGCGSVSTSDDETVASTQEGLAAR